MLALCKVAGEDAAHMAAGVSDLVNRKLDEALDQFEFLCFKYFEELAEMASSPEFNEAMTTEVQAVARHFEQLAEAEHFPVPESDLDAPSEKSAWRVSLEMAEVNAEYSRVICFLQAKFDKWIREAMVDLHASIIRMCSASAILLNALVRYL